MNNLSLHEQRVREYINKHYGEALRLRYDEVGEDYKVSTVFYSELEQVDVEGFPFSSDYLMPDGRSVSSYEFQKLSFAERKGARLRYYYMPYTHEMYVGGTGSGKTTGCVEPQLRAISCQKNKPNLFFTDPKGELFDRNAEHLREKGYKLYVLNFKDVMRSDKWNPLLSLYDEKIKLKSIGLGLKEVAGEVPVNMELFAYPEAFSKEKYYTYDGKAFPDTTSARMYIKCEEDAISARIDDQINQLVNMFIPVQNSKDPSWEYGAQDLLRGILQLMLDNAMDEKSGFTRDMMTLKTVQDMFTELKTPILDGEETLSTHPLTRKADKRVIRLLSTALGNAPNTMRSYCGVFSGAITQWFQAHVLSLTTGCTIDIENEVNSPYAIFVITRDYDKSDFAIAGLFIDWVYRTALSHSERGISERPLHFLLDEFGNIPKIKDFENKIATSRSRNIWFHLVLQSYAQLALIYGEDTSSIIRDNCNAQIFLGSQNAKSKEIFSEECGKCYVPTLRTELYNNEFEITSIPLVSITNLDLIKPGNMYVKRIYTPVIMAQFIRSYLMTENGDFPYREALGLERCAPFNLEPISSEKYTFVIPKNDDYLY